MISSYPIERIVKKGLVSVLAAARTATLNTITAIEPPRAARLACSALVDLGMSVIVDVGGRQIVVDHHGIHPLS